MRRQRAPQEAAGVSLFSFLAVLLCTMGALIVLLVVIARQARLQAAQVSADVATDVQDSLEDQQHWQAVIDRLRQERDLVASRLSDARLRLSHLEDHTVRLTGRLRQLRAEADDLQQAAAADEQARQRQRDKIQMLQAHLRAVEAELAEASQAQRQRAKSYAVIPYQGPNDTRRQPIYLECQADRIVLQPEGVMITAADFEHPIGPNNPLAAALRAAREHLSRTGMDPGSEPYPLLLVRPDGMTSYYLARRALASWGSEFGYELVDADWELELGRPDPNLARAEREAIAAARRRQEVLAQLPNRGALRGDRPVYRASRDRGGAVLDSTGFSPGGSRHTSATPHGRAGSGSPDFRDGSGTGNDGHHGGNPDRTFGSHFADGTGNGDDSQSGTGNESQQEFTRRGAEGIAMNDRANAADGTRGGQGTSSEQRRDGSSDGGDNSAGGGGGPSMADARGNGWGLQGRTPGSVGIARSIRIICRADSLIVLSTAPDQVPHREIALGRRTSDSLDDLMSAVWHNVDQWGTAGRGMHWRPELVVDVTPDATSRYLDLQSLLDRSGLVVRRQGDPVAETNR